ncbi:helix-turn-helix domain-containing protein [Rubellicoccus peritrichatus]|uniref:Helix-turn-helix domain-containing protein n=1 Tax=Rubellicoccus peritrichatus TaxID=3080537 RepID=A0AAQ3LBG0_9BACT|nr:helix-turn-helix domain-containing protein [Puniceicoccus sp. CR14]WOO41454.1 helix-turn-helix domain-containing protein [Puniceicoccus sp. CR14]
MPNIGERLEEARKRQGISVREAAEATKVRSDFLLNYENNNYDFDLPEVYRSGFLKVYARYLKLDVEKIMTDYNAVMLGNSKLNKRENKEFFGRMDLPEQTKPIGGADSEPPFGEHTTAKRAAAASAPMTGAPAESIDTQSDATLYWKIGLIFVGGFIVVALVALLIQAIAGGDDAADEIVGDPATVVQGDALPDTSGGADLGVGTGDFKIIANDDVLNVMVRQDIDREKLFGRSMSAGEEIIISRQGPVRVVSSDIDKITIELNGQKITSPSQGIGQIKLGLDGAEN